jgi:acyl-CoA reductase-like NAD-dependent aldehyde dehydrogenase
LFEAQLFINGRPVASEAGATYERRDPVSERVVTRAVAGSEDDAQWAADAAAGAFPDWSATSPGTRGAILMAAEREMAARTDEVVAIAAGELGSAEDWTRFNVDIARQILRQAATLCDAIAEEDVAEAPPGLSYRLSRRPAGVVLGIAPWNAAVTLATRAVAAPLACGNTVVLKGSELCPKTHEWVVRCLCDAGLPPGVLNYVTNAPERAGAVVSALIAHAAVRRVNFTGSTRVGREIAVEAARHLKPCLLELSGKGTMIVLVGADIDEAVKAAVHGAFFNQGQVCMSTERIIVEDSVADAFVGRLAGAARALRFDSDTGQSPLGALVSTQAPLRIRGLIDDAVARGAALMTGGEVQGTRIQPTVLDHVAPGMRIYAEEVFGPVAAIVRVGDAEEALSVGNDTEFGLVAAVFDRDAERALGLARSLDCGIVHVNGPTVYDDPAMPFGGLKASGYGRFGGRAALEEFTEIQWITVRDNDDRAARTG